LSVVAAAAGLTGMITSHAIAAATASTVMQLVKRSFTVMMLP
jgi:hypothetical protein